MQDFEESANSHAVDKVFRFTLPQREYGAEEDSTSEEAAPGKVATSNGEPEESLDNRSVNPSKPRAYVSES